MFPFRHFYTFRYKTDSQIGVASWYSSADAASLYTASGERFDDTEYTCASWDIPLGSLVRVTNTENRQSVICRVNDRGPNRKLNRLIDLTKAAFDHIAEVEVGLIHVVVERI